MEEDECIRVAVDEQSNWDKGMDSGAVEVFDDFEGKTSA